MRLCCDHERGDGMRTGVNIRKRKDGRYEAAIQRGGMQLESCSMDTATGTPLKEAREKRDRIRRSAPGDESADPWGRRTR